MLFSILVPVYNVEMYLKECIDSVMNQTEQDFELILINDGSVDSSGELCDLYAQKHSDKIIVYHQKNSGSLLARKSGLAKAKGDFCIFLDSDDYLRKDALQILKGVINKYNCDLVIYNYTRLLKNGKHIHTKAPFYNYEIFEGDKKSKLYEAMITDELPGYLVIKSASRKIIDINTDYTPFSSISICEDMLQSLPILTNAKKVVYINEHLYFYRYNPKGIAQTFKPDQYYSIRTVGYKMQDYLFAHWNLGSGGLKQLHSRNLIAIVSVIMRLCKTDWSRKQKVDYLYSISKDEFFIASYKGSKNLNLSIILYRCFCWFICKRHFLTLLGIIRLSSILRIKELNKWIKFNS